MNERVMWSGFLPRRIPQRKGANKVLLLVPVRNLTYSPGVIRAIVFDFNGVIADDETPHLLCFQQALAEAGLTLTKHDYYGAYLGMDERICTRLLLEQRDGGCDEAHVLRIAERKAELFRAHTAHHRPPLFPGVTDFVLAAKVGYRLAIASGGRRAQIEDALAGSAIEHAFEVIVTAEDSPIGKPDPAIYLTVCDRLNANRGSVKRITPSECLVIEDSLAGIRSARAAGMRVLAVSTTYPLEKLSEAEYAFRRLHDMTPEAAVDALSVTSSRVSAALSTPSKDE
jgi:beta-phosphoglucomutase